MDFASYKSLHITCEDRIVTVMFNRPEAMNAIDEPTEREFVRFLSEGTSDVDFDVVIVTGAGRAFSAGGDFDWLQAVIDDPSLFNTVQAKRVVFGLLDFPKPIIAKVNGHAIGLGATIALFCDVIFAAKHAKIGDPHVNVGFSAGDGGAIIWPQLIGFARAKEYLMTGDPLLAIDAERIGLINHAVDAEKLDAEVAAFAKRMAKGALRSISWTKQTVNIGLRQIATSVMDASVAYEALSNITQDHREAVAALREKRKPIFTGK
jgi:enoyl-CoA hydratase